MPKESPATTSCWTTPVGLRAARSEKLASKLGVLEKRNDGRAVILKEEIGKLAELSKDVENMKASFKTEEQSLGLAA